MANGEGESAGTEALLSSRRREMDSDLERLASSMQTKSAFGSFGFCKMGIFISTAYNPTKCASVPFSGHHLRNMRREGMKHNVKTVDFGGTDK